MTDAPAANEAMADIRADTILEPEYRHGDLEHLVARLLLLASALQGPVRITGLLRELDRLVLAIVGHLAFLERGFLLIGELLTRRRDNRSVDDLSRHGAVTSVFQRRFEAAKQRFKLRRIQLIVA